MLVFACDPRTREVEAGKSVVQGIFSHKRLNFNGEGNQSIGMVAGILLAGILLLIVVVTPGYSSCTPPFELGKGANAPDFSTHEEEPSRSRQIGMSLRAAT